MDARPHVAAEEASRETREIVSGTDWNQFLADSWGRIVSGDKVPVPASLPAPVDVGFVKTRLAANVGQVSDWALRLEDGSRLHVHGFGDGTFVVHRDRIDPSRGPVKAVHHWLADCGAECRTGKIAAGGAILAGITLAAILGKRSR